MTIRSFLFPVILVMSLSSCNDYTGKIMTVSGPVSPKDLGLTLTHEHILVDFVGADSINYGRWDREEVARKALPYLLEAKEFGTRTFIDATPEYIGRDPFLLRSVSEKAGMNIITNTGYYGAGRNRYIPAHAYKETTEQIAGRWIDEWKNGIEKSGVRPGFIKTGVMGGELSTLHRRLIRAAARTHLETGLVIASHTGPAIPAFEQLGILCEEGVSPEAFIWVHAQNETDSLSHFLAARAGAWISFDGLNDDNTNDYLRMIKNMKENDLLDHVLISHDAGWFRPGEEDGGEFRGFTSLFKNLIPALKDDGFTLEEINLLLIENPAKAFTIGVRKF
jgi:phosphotriesterase-related protein